MLLTRAILQTAERASRRRSAARCERLSREETAMTAEFTPRDYSLVGPDDQARGRERAGGGRVVRLPDPAQAAEGADAALRRAGDPRHDHLVRRLRRDRRARLSHLGHLVGRPLLHRLWRALRLLLRFALARMRPRHRLQDALDERRRSTRSPASWCCASRRPGAGAIRATTPTRSSSAAIRRSPCRARRTSPAS